MSFLQFAIRCKSVKKTNMPNSIQSLGYIKCYSSSSPRPVKSLTNSIRHNCQKICSWSRRPKTILEIKKGQISHLFGIGQLPCFGFGLSAKFISTLSHILYVCMALLSNSTEFLSDKVASVDTVWWREMSLETTLHANLM